MPDKSHADLSRRERQIMDIIYRLGGASAVQVMENLPDAPGYSGVRRLLALLEEKGWLKHRKDGPRYIYYPTVPRKTAARSAARRLVATFFDGSVGGAVAAILDASDAKLSRKERDRIARLIKKAEGEGR